ncbi:hypothetical protein HDG34_005893 [Paraburkholderia sp. HC6.4b]|uniref:hypothetical protein n=1 Tax=unclassified Paraburkholderia TaxID=2615204 RepID=UPI001617E9B6|nr:MULTISPECIES: hypothetical protein [unclassified Paraburkholderia]MBB5411927.1 hypothetical protein [Paraburkholderia sp. HC6.4b]MBB5450239.1 hypothetical protein [Paraburkholderia sp. Kb1A]
MMPSMLDAARGAFSCPAIVKLRGLATSDLPQKRKREEAYAAVIELRAFMDAQFSSPMFGMLLRAARLKDPNLPSHEQWMSSWNRVKAKMGSDGKFVAEICDSLPDVLARYGAANGIRIFGDPVIRRLAERGLS